MLVTQQEFTTSGRPQGGSIPEDLRDWVENVSPVDRPALGLFRKTRVTNTYCEWLEDTLPARGFNAYAEGVGHTDQALTTPSRSFNHIQQFARWGQVSDTQRAVDHKGFADALIYQERKSIEATLNDIEHAIQRGSAASGDTNVARQLKGLINIASTLATTSSGTTLTEDVFGDILELFVDGNIDVRPSVALVNSLLKRTISLYSTKNTFNVDAAAKVQTLVVEQHHSDFGDVKIFYTRDQLKATTKTTQGNSICLLDPNYFEVGFLQSLMSEQLARNGLRTQFQISAMCTLIYRTEKAIFAGQGYVAYI
jgi:hypothetical protein